MTFGLRHSACLLYGLFAVVPCAWAQETPPAPAAKPATPRTLSQGLRLLGWEAERQGVLLTVAPGDIGREANAPLLPAQPTMNEVATTFGCVARKFGGITTVAPQNITAINTRPGLADQNDERETSDNFDALLASLTDDQWRAYGSEQGLGYEGLSSDQQALFAGTIPDPFTLEYGLRDKTGERRTVRFVGKERLALRLRGSLLTSVWGRNVKGGYSMPLHFHLNLAERKLPAPYFRDQNQYRFQKETRYGQKLSLEMPNRLKPSDINFAVLTQTIPVTVPPDSKPGKPLYLGELVKRIGQSANIDLRADPRLASQPVFVVGETAPAGDVLRAVCYATGGTVRRVTSGSQSVYVLTDDREGFASRRAVVDDWEIAARSVHFGSNADFRDALKGRNLVRFLRFDPDEPVTLSPDLLKRLVSPEERRKGGQMDLISSNLPADQRSYILDQAQRTATEYNGAYAISADKIAVGVSLWNGYVLPDGTRIVHLPSVDYADLAADPLPKPAPPSPSGMSLVARVQTPDEARAVVAEAAKQKSGAVWLSFSETEAGRAALVAGIVVGKKVGLPVWAVVSLLRPVPTPPDLSPDVNALGETSDKYALRRWNQKGEAPWLVPDESRAGQTRAAFAVSIAQTPGLAGIVLRDTLPPGYREDARTRRVDVWNGDPGPSFEGAAANLGYTNAHRVAFLRENSADPMDVVPYTLFQRINLRFFDYDESTLALKWRVWRNERGATFLTLVRDTLQKNVPNVPVLWGGGLVLANVERRTQRGQTALYFSYPSDTPAPPLFWTTAAQGTQATMLSATKGTPVETTRPKMGRVLLDVGGPSRNNLTAGERAASLADKCGPGWDGYVLDLSYLPWPDAQKALQTMADAAKPSGSVASGTRQP